VLEARHPTSHRRSPHQPAGARSRSRTRSPGQTSADRLEAQNHPHPEERDGRPPLGQLSNPSDQVNQGIPSLEDRSAPAIASSPDQGSRRPKRLNQLQVEALIEAYRLGATIKDLAVEHGIHRVTVMEHLRRNEIPTRSDSMRWSTEQLIEVTELYHHGNSIRVLGERYGLDPSTVARRLKRSGVQLRPRRGFA
jgi:transposase-like protein